MSFFVVYLVITGRGMSHVREENVLHPKTAYRNHPLRRCRPSQRPPMWMSYKEVDCILHVLQRQLFQIVVSMTCRLRADLQESKKIMINAKKLLNSQPVYSTAEQGHIVSAIVRADTFVSQGV